ncbi:carboxypeptidase regulatory-like domain-containing protein [Flavobacterium sp. Fl-318]|uniref:Carboxypeptidase regulatory-like domain-containing protein n=1 Tax=Flavobacterium cupriresistens TaxID=2893885 RepID=A0ABU4RHC8_9FLAO|nr:MULTISPECIES: carboxypeptidase regulatory-like domain-containing protein [unclassified Flavobacterium]MDX6191963.1 carboxypeptidase regulatory-like domain-containing protein [Flavobacterium sp. Fl-318]UFH44603.1 TonB-dependent receptor [Flavobacterium sp. F-323]
MSWSFRIIVFFFLAFFPLQRSLAQVYSIEGFVKSSNNTTLPNITIVLKGLQNSVSSQRIFTDSLGYYRFDNIKQGRYIVAAESQEYGISVSDTIDLGAVSPKAVHHFLMEISAKALDEVVITNKKALIEAEKGKMIFNVAGNAANSGISAFEVLKKIPGITIGQNDDILLKGTSGANIMIDGKMSYITGNQLAIYLKGLSADDVSKIEVITNPSAAFDASGNSGLINIVTKANKKKGYALNLRSSISKGAFWMNNQNISAGMNQDKWNAYASFDYNTPHRKRTGESGNSIIENDQKITLSRENNIPFKIYYYTWKIGGSWKLAFKRIFDL